MKASVELSLIGNQFTDHKAGRVTTENRGFAYGDGLFETVRFIDGRLPLIEFHLARLFGDAKRLHLFVDESDIRFQLKRFVEKINSLDQDFGTLKVVVTRSPGKRGNYLPEPATAAEAAFIFKGSSLVDFRERRVELLSSKYMMPNSPMLSGMKHMSRLEYTCAELFYGKPVKSNQELLVLDQGGNILEALHHNVFLVYRDQITTPELINSGVHGVMRKVVMEIATGLGLCVKEEPISVSALAESDSVFITNAFQGVVPVEKFAKNNYKNFGVVRELQSKIQQQYAFYES